MPNSNSENKKDFEEKVLEIKRVSKKTEGGNRFRFTALVIVGDRDGQFGVGLGRAPKVREAIEKGVRIAKENLVTVPLEEGTIPFPVEVEDGAAHIILRPSSSGIVAGGPLRVIANLAGIEDISGKILGTRNKLTNSLAVIEAIEKLNKMVDKYESL
ncbi:MAG: ribosomal protein S5 [Patescibacteria group bacterium]